VDQRQGIPWRWSLYPGAFHCLYAVLGYPGNLLTFDQRNSILGARQRSSCCSQTVGLFNPFPISLPLFRS